MDRLIVGMDSLRIDVYVHSGPAAEDPRMDQIVNILNIVKGNTEKIMATEQQALDALKIIDTATTKIAGNVTAIVALQVQQGGAVKTISDDVDSLLASLQSAGVPQDIIDQATAIGTKATAAGAASDGIVAAAQALVPVLQGIAGKGAVNPVPVPPPPPPQPPTVTP